MPTLISDQRGHYAFHPYQSMSQTSRGSSISYRVHRFCPITQALVSSRIKTSSRLEAPHQRRSVEKEPRNIASLDHGASATISNFTQAIRTNPSLHPLLHRAALAYLIYGTHHNIPIPTLSQFRSHRPRASVTPRDYTVRSRSVPTLPVPLSIPQWPGARTLPQLLPHPAASLLLSSSSSKNVPALRDIVSYLKAWRPPVEYYARRRYQHPSLSYPSRRPSLPAYWKSVRHLSSQGWSDESEEDLASDGSDDDEESDDEDEAVTPTTSPASSTTYFLQPLVLTKLPDYS
ncbi:hypothetical protein PCASD_26113 [Puccinia coronata f. sp. avenae]|uniref:Uncharacterized protein n=1 Tax=Puccinia coronata f. sp. avenae TaxID=200324 RepID=A0A2N5RWC9_9BASI|nr:hypothetical protein PCASD_26113 [Puccinia coronata f. sp. avenae]